MIFPTIFYPTRSFFRPPPRPSPGSIEYSEEEESKHYEAVHRQMRPDQEETSSLTEKADLQSQTDSQVSFYTTHAWHFLDFSVNGIYYFYPSYCMRIQKLVYTCNRGLPFVPLLFILLIVLQQLPLVFVHIFQLWTFPEPWTLLSFLL